MWSKFSDVLNFDHSHKVVIIVFKFQKVSKMTNFKRERESKTGANLIKFNSKFSVSFSNFNQISSPNLIALISNLIALISNLINQISHTLKSNKPKEIISKANLPP